MLEVKRCLPCPAGKQKIVERHCDRCGKLYAREAHYIGRYCGDECHTAMKSKHIGDLRKRRKMLGLCTACGEQLDTDGATCTSCRAKSRKSYKHECKPKTYIKCFLCGSEKEYRKNMKIDDGNYTCADCGKWHREGQAALKKSVTKHLKRYMDGQGKVATRPAIIAEVMYSKKYCMPSEFISMYFPYKEDYDEFKELPLWQAKEELEEAIDSLLEGA